MPAATRLLRAGLPALFAALGAVLASVQAAPELAHTAEGRAALAGLFVTALWQAFACPVHEPDVPAPSDGAAVQAQVARPVNPLEGLADAPNAGRRTRSAPRRKAAARVPAGAVTQLVKLALARLADEQHAAQQAAGARDDGRIMDAVRATTPEAP